MKWNKRTLETTKRKADRSGRRNNIVNVYSNQLELKVGTVCVCLKTGYCGAGWGKETECVEVLKQMGKQTWTV